MMGTDPVDRDLKPENTLRLDVGAVRGADLAPKMQTGLRAPRRFGVIMADPPWPYDSPRALVGSRGRGAIPGIEHVTQVDVSAHYPTMSLDEIQALSVASLAERDAFLFLWATNPFLADGSASGVVKAWGFRPISVLTWAKIKPDGTPSMKTGHWFRSASEHVVFAVRGKPRRPAGWAPLPTWLGLPRLAKHSAKPDDFFRLAERFGDGPCLEMFARGGPRGERWSVWGTEASSELPSTTKEGT